MIEDALWDHYSGLPNPLWYQQNNETDNEENNTDHLVNTESDTAKVQENAKKQMGPLKDQPTYNTDLQVYQFEDNDMFTPAYSPIEMIEAGVFGGNYFGNVEVNKDWLEYVPSKFITECTSSHIRKLTNTIYAIGTNKYGVSCGMDYKGWTESGWIKEQDPYGWFNWYINFYYGRRSVDDARQISRWKSFIGRHPGMLKSICVKAKRDILDESFGKKTRQNLLHWAYKIK